MKQVAESFYLLAVDAKHTTSKKYQISFLLECMLLTLLINQISGFNIHIYKKAMQTIIVLHLLGMNAKLVALHKKRLRSEDTSR